MEDKLVNEGGDFISREKLNELLYSKDNLKILNDIFPEIYQPTSEPSDYSIIKKGWILLNTPKVMFLYTSKGGSSFIRNTIVEPNNRNEVDINKNTKLKPINCGDDLKFKPFSFDIDLKNSSDEFSEFDKFLNGKSKKDLILLVRNPSIKWISGIIMDIKNTNYNSITYSLLEKAYGVDLIGTDFDEWPENIISDLTYIYIKNQISSYRDIDPGHSRLYSETNHSFFSYHKHRMNLDKFKIFDLDSVDENLLDVILSYYPELKKHTVDLYWTQRTQWKSMFGKVMNSIQREQQYELIERIRAGVYRDYHYYKLMERDFKNNYINKIK